MSEAFDLDTAVAWLRGFADRIAAEKDHLIELDSAIGDGDHGANLNRGMTAVSEELASDPADLATVFKQTGMRLVSSVGGAAGPLYGTFFLRLSATIGDAAALDAEGLAAALRAGCDGVAARGKAHPGEKTMLDALVPAIDAWTAAVDTGLPLAAVARSAVDAARDGRDATVPMLATKGRASYLGERSIGHLDPGATSATLLMEALADAVDGDA